MSDQYDYSGIRATGIALIKKFGRKTPCVLLRSVEPTAPDSSKPWRTGGAATIKQFKFIGIVSYLGFPKRSDPIVDRDLEIYAPGDLRETAAEGDPSTLCGVPTVNDRIVTYDPEQENGILGIQPVQPDAKPILYVFRCRAWPLLVGQASTPF